MKKSTLLAEFDQAVHIVDSSFPSLYTKEDVIKVLRNLETTLKDFISDKEETYESIINIDDYEETILFNRNCYPEIGCGDQKQFEDNNYFEFIFICKII